jgi:putative transposase
MTRKRFTEEQITKALKEVDGGAEVRDVCERFGVAEQSFYRWRPKYGGLEVSEARRLREQETENGRLKRMVTDLMLDNQILRDVNSKSGDACGPSHEAGTRSNGTQ